MKRVLFATTNPAKIKKYAQELEKRDIEIVTLQDLGLNLHVEENGKNTIENANLKAKAYYEATQLPTIGMDNALWLEGIPDEKQPGTHVRRVGGKELTDDEMIVYYSNLAKEYGGKIMAKWIFGMVICQEKGTEEYSWSKDHFYLVDTPCEKREPGYPLDSISIMPQYHRYFLELTPEQKNEVKQDYHEEEVIDFIMSHI